MSRLQWINKLNDNDFKKLFESIDFVFFDMDGVLLFKRKIINGSKDCYNKIKQLGKSVGIVTNSADNSPQFVLKRYFNEFIVPDSEINSPVNVCMDYLKEIKFEKDIFYIGGVFQKEEFEKAGYKIFTYKDIFDQPENSVMLVTKIRERTLEVCKNVGLVFLSVDYNFCHVAAQIVFTILNYNKDVILLSGNDDDLQSVSEDYKLIGSWYYIDAIQRWSNKKCIQMSKPGSIMGKYIITKYGITDPSRVLFIGDGIESDITFGLKHNFKTLLLLSGITSRDDVENWKFSENLKPHYVAESLNDLLQKLN